MEMHKVRQLPVPYGFCNIIIEGGYAGRGVISVCYNPFQFLFLAREGVLDGVGVDVSEGDGAMEEGG